VDIDGPLLLKHDHVNGLQYHKGQADRGMKMFHLQENTSPKYWEVK